MSKTIVVASGKGGTGKSMLVVNLGAALALKGHKVILVDLDTGMRNLDLYLGFENNVVYDVNDVMNGTCRIKQAVIKDKSFPNLCFMAASPFKSDGEITPLHVKVLCKQLEELFDYVIIDAPAGIDDGLLISLGGTDKVLLVINPEAASIRDGQMVAKALQEKGITNIYYVINKIHLKLMKAGITPSLEEISMGIRDRIIGLIPYDENIHISTNLGVPVALMKDLNISKTFKKIADRAEKILV